jgi:hypothetical protein
MTIAESGGFDDNADGARARLGLDDDLHVLPECSEKVHQALGGKAFKLVMQERGELTFHRLADIPLRWVLRRVKSLDLEFTFAVRGRNIEPELPSEPLGAGNLSDAAMLIPLTIESHLATLPGFEDESTVSTVVFCGVCKGSYML